MRKSLLSFILFSFIEDNPIVEHDYIGIITTSIIDLQAHAFDIDTMYTNAYVLDITFAATYESNATILNEQYNKVSPRQYNWSV